MTRTEKITIPDSEICGKLAAIDVKSCFSGLETGFREVERDIQRYNEIVTEKTGSDILRKSNPFLQRRFANLLVCEVFLRSRPQEQLELLCKSRCKCGNLVVAPLKALVEGSLTNCGCKAPLPQTEYPKSICVYPSEQPTRWTTTVDGIQWLGRRYLWFVSLFVEGICVVQEYTEDTGKALQIRRDAEHRYYGHSNIDQYEDAMYMELEQLRRAYLARHPPKVEGIYKLGNLWNARLRHQNKLVVNESFRARGAAVQARLQAEKKYLGAPIMAEKYYT